MSQENSLDMEQMTSAVIKAVQSCVWNYPTYNLSTEYQNYVRNSRAKEANNPLLRKGRKFFSQNDEDGILLEILKRIEISKNKKYPTFIEFGVESGLECNSIILLMHGWCGAWVGGSDLAFQIPNPSRLHYSKNWVTLDNIMTIYNESLAALNTDSFDFLSMDLDGNDYHFLKAIVDAGHRPKVIIAEYNAKFPPPINFTIKYDDAHIFNSDYFGASLQTLNNLFAPNGYFLVACNITGSNCFFVDNQFQSAFTDIPSTIDEIFIPALYGIVTRVGHPVSPKTICSFIE